MTSTDPGCNDGWTCTKNSTHPSGGAYEERGLWRRHRSSAARVFSSSHAETHPRRVGERSGPLTHARVVVHCQTSQWRATLLMPLSLLKIFLGPSSTVTRSMSSAARNLAVLTGFLRLPTSAPLSRNGIDKRANQRIEPMTRKSASGNAVLLSKFKLKDQGRCCLSLSLLPHLTYLTFLTHLTFSPCLDPCHPCHPWLKIRVN